MIAVERIKAAIDKLTEWKAQPEPPFLVSFDPEIMNDGDNDDTVSTAFNAGMDWGTWRARNQVADTQLSILQEALRQASDPRFMFPWTGYDRAAIALADAILGSTP